MDTFNWSHSIQWSKEPEDTLRLGTTEVARLHQRVDDLTWFVALDTHLEIHPQRRRNCTSYESGRAGAEMWAKRHEERLRREVAERAGRRGWGR